VARIYSMARVLCDTHMRERLDPVSPASLRPVFKRVLRHLQRGKALAPLTFLEGHSRLALDDTGVLCLHDASRCVVSAHGAPQRFNHLYASDARRGEYPSGHACSDSVAFDSSYPLHRYPARPCAIEPGDPPSIGGKLC